MAMTAAARSQSSVTMLRCMGRLVILPINRQNQRVVFLNCGGRQFSVKASDVEIVSKEVGIPVPGGTLAGKLWESKLPKKLLSSKKDKEADDVTPVPVICLHGWLDNAGSFDLLLPLMMTPSMKFFCLDLPGHGLTTYCPDWWYDSHVEGILAVRRAARHFGWDKFSIFGHSLGGIIGFLYAAYFPQEVHKLVAMENIRPIPIPLDGTIDMMRTAVNLVFEVEERMRHPKKTYSYKQIMEKLFEGRQETICKEGCMALLKRGASKRESNHYQFSYNLRTHIPGQEGRTPPELCLKLAKEITSPVCYIKANPGNIYETKEEREAFINVLKGNLGDTKFQFHSIPGTHHLHLNDPKTLAPIIQKFLADK